MEFNVLKNASTDFRGSLELIKTQFEEIKKSGVSPLDFEKADGFLWWILQETAKSRLLEKASDSAVINESDPDKMDRILDIASESYGNTAFLEKTSYEIRNKFTGDKKKKYRGAFSGGELRSLLLYLHAMATEIFRKKVSEAVRKQQALWYFDICVFYSVEENTERFFKDDPEIEEVKTELYFNLKNILDRENQGE